VPHDVKFGDVIPTGPKVIGSNALYCAPIFEFLLHPHFFQGASEFLDLTFKAAPISDHVAKFHGDRWRELGDFAPNVKSNCPEKICGEAPTIFGIYISKCAHFQSHFQNFKAIGRDSSEI